MSTMSYWNQLRLTTEPVPVEGKDLGPSEIVKMGPITQDSVISFKVVGVRAKVNLHTDGTWDVSYVLELCNGKQSSNQTG